MAQIAGAINAVATKLAVGINEVPSGLARALQQHADGEGTAS
jgi:large subunit ribosomal protein L10